MPVALTLLLSAVRGLAGRLLGPALGLGARLATGNAGAALVAGAVAVIAALAVGLGVWAFWPRHDATAAAELARGAERARAETLTKALADRDAAAVREAAAREAAETYRAQVGELADQITAQIEGQPAAADAEALPPDVVALIAARQRHANARLK